MSFSEYPLLEYGYLSACELAKQESLLHPDHFIYVFKKYSGAYVIDYMSVKHDDELHMVTYKNGNISL